MFMRMRRFPAGCSLFCTVPYCSSSRPSNYFPCECGVFLQGVRCPALLRTCAARTLMSRASASAAMTKWAAGLNCCAARSMCCPGLAGDGSRVDLAGAVGSAGGSRGRASYVLRCDWMACRWIQGPTGNGVLWYRGRGACKGAGDSCCCDAETRGSGGGWGRL